MFEKKHGKRFLASVMALVMLLSLAPLGTLAADAQETQTNTAVTLPANEADQKPVETGTANTNEETTPPPSNEGIATLPANNNNTPVALPETPVIVKPAEGLIDEAFGVDADTSKNNGVAEYGNNNYKEQTVKVAVYATDGSSAGSKVNTDIAKLLGIPCKQKDGYYPIGVIEINKNLVNGHGPFITSEDDWNAVKEAISEISTDELKDNSEDDNVGDVKGSENKENKVKDNLDKVQPDRRGTAGTYKTALFRWNGLSKNIEGDYEYHLDLRFATVTLKFVGVIKRDLQKIDMGNRIYLTNTEILEPGTSDDFYLTGIPNGYQINGYYSDENLNTAYKFDNKKATADDTIYVELVQEPVKITYNLNEGNLNGERDPVVYNDLHVGDTMPAPNDPERKGYTFKGWKDNDDNPPSKQVTGDATYFAQWSINKHKVTYKDGANNAVFSEQVTDNVEYGTQIPQFSENGANPTRQGYTFTGWACDVTGITTNSTMPDQDVTFTAQWKAETVTAKYFINLGGRDASKPDGSGTFTNGIEISEAINLVEFKNHAAKGYGNNGYIFNEEGVEKLCAGLLPNKPNNQQINDALSAKGKSDMHVGVKGRYIVWYHVSDCTNRNDGYHVDGYVANASITITYDPAGGKFADGNRRSESGISGTPYTIIKETPAREGYTFTGWKLDGNDTLYQPNGSITPTGDVTLVAQWEPVANLSYTVNYLEKGTNEVLHAPKTESNKTFEDTITAANEVITIDGYNYDSADKATLTIGTGENVINLYYTKRTDLSYTVNYLEKGTNTVLHAPKMVPNKTFKDTIAATDEVISIDGYTYDSADKETLTIGTSENVINLYYVKRTNLSYTVNYLEKGTNKELLTPKTESNKTFKDTITAADEVITIDGYNYDSADKTTLTIGTSENVINLYYVKRNDLSYTVNYLEKDSNTVLCAPKTVPNKTFEDIVTAAGEVITINGYTYDSADKETLTIGTSENVINLYYTKATQYKIIIHYVDDAQTPNTLQKDTVIEGKYENNSYNVNEEIPARIGDYVKESVTGNVTGTVGQSDVIITVVYTKDVLVDPTAPETDGPGDNIPDKYQVVVKYVPDTTGRGTVGTLTEEVLTIYENDKEGKWASTGKVTASGSTATAVGSRNYFSNWTNDANVNTSNAPATLGQQVINAEGGKTYTFTANFGRSGGSSRPSTPTIDIIDDDVPTGLNGADHYAYIIGYGNNDVRPQNNITRAEVATIFFRLLTDDTREANMTKNQNYSDVKDSNWFCRPVATLSAMNIIKGYNDGSFQPNGNITRAEFAAIAARFDPDGDTTPATFTDVAGHWAEKEISIAANHGWINGYEDGSFRPNQYITRAEAMTLINRVLNRLPETKDDLHKDMKTWVDNMDETAWYYLAVQEATNSHYNDNKEGTKFEKWTDMRETRDWSELEK